MADALALGGDEGRDKLRKVTEAMKDVISCDKSRGGANNL